MKMGKYYDVYLVGGYSQALEALGQSAWTKAVLFPKAVHLFGPHPGVDDNVLAPQLN